MDKIVQNRLQFYWPFNMPWRVFDCDSGTLWRSMVIAKNRKDANLLMDTIVASGHHGWLPQRTDHPCCLARKAGCHRRSHQGRRLHLPRWLPLAAGRVQGEAAIQSLGLRTTKSVCRMPQERPNPTAWHWVFSWLQLFGWCRTLTTILLMRRLRSGFTGRSNGRLLQQATCRMRRPQRDVTKLGIAQPNGCDAGRRTALSAKRTALTPRQRCQRGS
jgi:hypothetical protein